MGTEGWCTGSRRWKTKCGKGDRLARNRHINLLQREERQSRTSADTLPAGRTLGSRRLTHGAGTEVKLLGRNRWHEFTETDLCLTLFQVKVIHHSKSIINKLLNFINHFPSDMYVNA